MLALEKNVVMHSFNWFWNLKKTLGNVKWLQRGDQEDIVVSKLLVSIREIVKRGSCKKVNQVQFFFLPHIMYIELLSYCELFPKII